MANKMIIDASHPEETRVVVLRGNRVEEFDFEAASKKPLRGNIYLAKVARVEPSLQAAFVDYGGNRHGFLAFSEIHPDYYQIPVADRQALLEEEARAHLDDEDEPNGERRSRRRRHPRQQEQTLRADDGETISAPAEAGEAAEREFGPLAAPGSVWVEPAAEQDNEPPEAVIEARAAVEPAPPADEAWATDFEPAVAAPLDSAAVETAESLESPPPMTAPDFVAPTGSGPVDVEFQDVEPFETEAAAEPFEDADEYVEPAYDRIEAVEPATEDDDEPEVTTLGGAGSEETEMRAPRPRGDDEGEPVEVVGGDAMDETPRRAPRLRRTYKIQEVIKRRQVLLVQVVKEERGNKGAALTTYLSLAGRYSVLMPNTARGGGISRKITNAQDRSRLKSIAEELDVPEGMGVILRTAGASRTKQEVKRDFEYLLRMWETVRETTLASSAPMLVYEEGSLIKRAIRDLYTKDVEEIVVAGDAGYREARAFMRLLMPNHVKAVVAYRDVQPAFAKAGVESQLDAMFSNQVTLKSGGYIVINQTEALVAIDVNSGRSTREHNIEDTALRTNLEAADEIARQLRLRDLAGLIVVDFIDMEESRNNRAVERRMKEALKNDRARIQVGRISHFGLLEMSRQRIRTGVLEGSTVPCPHCMGAGVVRSTSSIALHVLRVLEDSLIKSSTHDVIVRTRSAVALYILNQKRAHLHDLEQRFGIAVFVEADDTLSGATYHAFERGEPASGRRASEAELEHRPAGYGAPPDDEDFTIEEIPEAEEEAEAPEAVAADEEIEPAEIDAEAEAEGEEARGDGEDGERGRRRRRRRRRRGGERPPGEFVAAEAPQPDDEGLAVVAEIGGDFSAPAATAPEEDTRAGSRRRRPRRGRRGVDRFAGPGGEEPASGGEIEAEGHAAGADATAEAAEPFEQPELPWHTPLAAAEPAEPVPVSVEPVQEDAGEPEPAAAAAESIEPAAEPVAAIEPMTSAEPEAEASAAVEPAEPEAHEELGPRRTGWWQRARATIVGD
ncbi:MAG: Rne/Rng family ribonuclease [Roseiarcus sp.]